MKRAMQSTLVFRLALLSLFFFALVPMVGRSAYLLNPISISIADGRMVFVRELPLGAQTARWKSEIFVPSTGDECEVSGENMYHPRPFDTLRFDIDGVLLRCLEAPGIKVMTSQWTVILFGWFPLRPVTLVTTFGGE